MKAYFSVFILWKASVLVAVTQRFLAMFVLAGRSKGCRRKNKTKSERGSPLTHLEVDPVRRAWWPSNFVLCGLKLLDGGERPGSLHHGEEGGVGGGEHVEEEEAGHEHYQEDQPAAPLSWLGLRSLGQRERTQCLRKY